MRPMPDRLRSLTFLPVAVLALAPAVLAAPAYHDDEALATALKLLDRQHTRIRLTTLATTPGGRDVPLLRVAPPGGDGEGTAILVVADPLGTCPLATEAALELARELVAPPDGTAPGRADSVTWYIVPRLDPDGAARFFAGVRRRDGRNGQPRDDDADGTADEDPAEDLDGDGTVRVMLLPDPAGEWIRDPDDPRLYREAAPERGERGRYRKLVEGDDTDGDGAFNEDGPGGVVPGRNFPHDFEHWTTDAGPWPAYCPETRALLAFAYDHPEIAMVLELGTSNTLREVPEPDKPLASGGKYRLPRWLAREAGLDPRKEYTLDDLVDLVREYTGDRELTAEDVLSFLGLGIPRAPHRRDMGWWREMSGRYGEFLEKAGLAGERVDPAPVRGGGVAAWGYYQLGVPSLALDFWSVPAPADSTGDEEPGAGETTGDAPLPPDRNAGAKRGQAPREAAGGSNPHLKALATFATEHPVGPGGRPVWSDWHEVVLADGRTALVGGPDLFALRNPPDAMVDSLLTRQVPWLREMAGWLPRLGELAVERRDRGGGVEEVTVVLPNTGRLPYPTAMGDRTGRVPPVVVTVEGATVLHGRPRRVVDEIPAGGAATVTWLLHGRRGDRVTVTASAAPLGTRRLVFTLGDTKGGRR